MNHKKIADEILSDLHKSDILSSDENEDQEDFGLKSKELEDSERALDQFEKPRKVVWK